MFLVLFVNGSLDLVIIIFVLEEKFIITNFVLGYNRILVCSSKDSQSLSIFQLFYPKISRNRLRPDNSWRGPSLPITGRVFTKGHKNSRNHNAMDSGIF